jgi:hypothetical protein
LRKRMAVACSEAGVEVVARSKAEVEAPTRSVAGVEAAACSKAEDEAVVCSGPGIEDSRRRRHNGVLGDRRESV